MRLAPTSLGFIILCGALAAFPSLSIDIGLPAFSAVGAALKASVPTVALTLTVFFAGFSIAPLFYGPLSDGLGRRPVLLVGCAIYAAASIFCTIAQSIEALLWWRLVQGMSAGAGAVLSMSLVRDHHDGARARSLLSYIAVIRIIGPMMAPMLGAVLLGLGGWRWVYGFMAVGGTMLFLAVYFGLEESAPRFRTTNYHASPMWRSYLTLLGNPLCVGYALVVAFGFGSQFAYVTGSSLIMMEIFGLSAHAYALLFGCMAFGIMSASYISGRLNAAGVSGVLLVAVGVALAFASTAIMVLLTVAHVASVATLVPFLFINTFCFGLITPNAQQQVLQPVPSIAGAAAAFINALMMGTGALASAIVEALVGSSGVLAMTGVMAGFCALAALAFVFTYRRERGRHAARTVRG